MVENTNSTILEVQGSVGLTYMVGFIPLNLRSQERDMGVPRARAPPPAGPGEAWRGVAWRGEASGGAPLSLGTRENPLSEPQSSRRVRVFPSRDSARTEKREGRCLRSLCRLRPCTGIDN
jgi:hypothetical protein